jgi:hypothetical protein
LINLHSRYNPVAEAQRYLDALPLRQGTRFFILIEPGEGYLIPILNQRFPAVPVIVLHLTDSFSSPGNCLSWSPALGPLHNFLEKAIPDIEARFVHIIEWRPAALFYGKLYVQLLSDTIDFLKRIDANARTAQAFGKRWVKNFFRNLDIIRLVCPLPPLPFSSSCIITGAGPSLETVLPCIRQRAGFIIAASSSVLALRAGKIEPDLIIATDGGTWALFHLYECLREKRSFTLAASMLAALPSQCSAVPVIPIADSSLWQTLILRALHIPCIVLPQRGTVTATALDFAFNICSGNIGIAGVDLAHADIRTHARPNTFDRFHDEQANRYNPVYSQRFIQAAAITDGSSLAIYTSWFKQQMKIYPHRLFSIGANNPIFASLPAWQERADHPFSLHLNPLPITATASEGKNILLEALEQTKTADTIRHELAPLLFPGASEEISVMDLKNKLQSLV